MRKMGIQAFLREESGQGMVEYGLIIALASLVVIGALTGFANARDDMFTSIISAMTEAM